MGKPQLPPPEDDDTFPSRFPPKLIHLLGAIASMADYPGLLVVITEALGNLGKVLIHFDHDPRMADVSNYKGKLRPLS